MQLLNFENWTNGGASVACKNQSFKFDHFILPWFLVPKSRSVAKNEWKKHPYSKVPIKQVGPNKQVGWIFYVNFIKNGAK